MEAYNLRKLLILTILVVLNSTFGCRAARDVYDVSTQAADSITGLILPDGKPILKKKVLLAPVINRGDISTSMAEEIRQECVSYLSTDEYVVVNTLKQLNDSDPEFIQKQYGAVINPVYVKKAAEMGMNILTVFIVHPFEITKKRTGIWPLRKDTHRVLLSVSVNAVDTVNGTLIVNKNKSVNIDFGETNPGDMENWAPDYNIIKNKISSLTKDLSSSVIEGLRKAPWQSQVAIDGDNLVIKAGKETGINENTVFELFKKGEPLESFSGEEYFVFGEKIGETRVKYLSGDKAVLAGSTNGYFRDTAFARVKRKD